MANKTQNDVTEGEIQTGEDWTRPVWRPRGQLQRRRRSRGHAMTKAKDNKAGIRAHEVGERSDKEMVPITGRQEAGARKERGGGRSHDRVKNNPSKRTRK